MPIYVAVVKVNGEEQTRLVDAPNEARALRHVTAQHVSLEVVRSAEQIAEVATLAAKGVQMEKVAAD